MATIVSVTPYSPANGAVNQPTSLTLSWNKTNLQTATVRVLFSTNYSNVLNFNSSVIVSTTATTSYAVSGLSRGTTYYWRVWSAAGGPNYASDVFSFTVIPNPPSKATNPTPVNGAVNIPLEQILRWNNGGGATHYDVWLGTSPGSLTRVSASQTATSYDPVLSVNTLYYWRVDAINAGGSQVTQGDLWHFTTVNPLPPDKPDIVAPLNDAADVPRSQQLQWKDGTSGDPASSYDIYFGTTAQAVTDAITASAEFKTNQSHTGDRTATQSYTPASLGNNVDYYWRIDAKNAQGTTKGDTWHFKTVQVQLGSPIEKVYRKKLIALADNKFWYEDNVHQLVSMGSLEVVTGDGLDLTKPLAIVSAYQKVFVVNGSVKKVVDFSNTRIRVSAMAHIPLRSGILTQTNGAAMVIDYIDAANRYIYGFVTNGTFATSQTATVTEDGVGYDYSVTAVRNVSTVPLFYNWAVFPHDDDTAAEKVNGKMPDEPTILALYRGRIVQSGDKNSPHVVYMSEQANPFNFTYGTENAASASAVTGGYAGNIGDVVSAVVPYKDDYMILGCSQTMWLMRGDPAAGGSIDQISFTAGLFDKTSFAWDSEDNLYFLDSNGIYKIPAGFGAVQKLTQQTLPDFVTDFALAPDVHRVTMAYDRKKHGILICKTDLDTGQNANFWLDLRTGGFFPEEYPSDCSVYAANYYTADDPAYRELLLGCRDGFIRIFDARLYKDQTGDSEAAIESFMLIGPGRIAAENRQGLLTHLLLVLSEESSAIGFELYTAKTAQEVIASALDENAAPHTAGTIAAGISSTVRPRCRGAYLILKLVNNSADASWAFEKTTGYIIPAGALR